VARFAVDHGVGSQERKPVLVSLHSLHDRAPAAHRVALLALRPELPPVNIGVAVDALSADLGEHKP